MAWKRLTFLLIPHSQDNIKQIGLPRHIIYALSIFLIAAIGIMIFYIIGFRGKSFQVSRTRDLINKNQLLMEHIAVFDSSLSVMSAQIAHLESINTSIITESEISDTDLKFLGAGEVKTRVNDTGILPERIVAMINRIDKESEAFEYNFNTLFDECMKHSDFVMCIPSIRPADGIITKEFGLSHDKLSQKEKAYPGVDINNVEGTPVIATADGVVQEINFSQEIGQYIIIDHLNGYTTRYAHIQTLPQMARKIRLKKGDPVTRGQQIGAIGRTGVSIPVIAAHLMYSVYHQGIPVNPRDYFFAPDFAAVIPEGIYEAQVKEPRPD